MFDLPETKSEKRAIRKDLSLGYEFYKPGGTLWDWMLAAAAQVERKGRACRPLLIDFGGASGFKAMQLARQGYNALVIDLVIDGRTVRERKRFLSQEDSASGWIGAVEKDVRTLSASTLTDLCDRRAPRFCMGFNFIHFLKPQELAAFFDLLYGVSAPDTRVALSYANARSLRTATKNRPHMTFHDETDVACLAAEKGFRLIHSESKRNGNHTGQAFALAAS